MDARDGGVVEHDVVGGVSAEQEPSGGELDLLRAGDGRPPPDRRGRPGAAEAQRDVADADGVAVARAHRAAVRDRVTGSSRSRTPRSASRSASAATNAFEVSSSSAPPGRPWLACSTASSSRRWGSSAPAWSPRTRRRATARTGTVTRWARVSSRTSARRPLAAVRLRGLVGERPPVRLRARRGALGRVQARSGLRGRRLARAGRPVDHRGPRERRARRGHRGRRRARARGPGHLRGEGSGALPDATEPPRARRCAVG